MIQYGALRLSLFWLAVTALPSAAQAQDEQQAKKLQASLTEGARVRAVSGIPLDPAKAGYYRVVVSTAGFQKDSLCWTSKKQRDAIADTADRIWSYAVKRKKDWGAGIHLVFNGTKPDFDAENFSPDLWVKLFAVQIDGSSIDQCQVKAIDFGTYESPLIPIDTTASPAETFIQISTWYNDKTDRQQLANLFKGGTALFGLAGVPLGALQVAETPVVDEIQRKTDKKRTSSYRTQLSPFNANKIETVGYVGLREPSETTTATDPRVNVKLVPVASMFDVTKASFDQMDLSTAAAARILKLPLTAADGTITYLDSAIGTKTPLLQSMLTDPSDAGASSTCENLSLLLMNQLKFSVTDTAIMLYGIAKQRIDSGITKNLRDISCISSRVNILERVKISIKSSEIVKNPVAISQDVMKDRMNTLAQFRVGDASEMPQANWSIFAFPLTVYDAADKLGLEDQRMRYTAENRAGLKSLFDAKLTNMGCWAYFDSDNFAFAPGLGDPDPAKAIRKSAALVRLVSGDVLILQVRYNGDPDGQKIDGLAFTRSDKAAKEMMLKSPSCNATIAGKEWMQSFLQP